MKRLENKCSNCKLWRTHQCPESRGVIIWKNCWKFQPDLWLLQLLKGADHAGN